MSIVWQIWEMVISAKNSIFRYLKPFLVCHWGTSGIAIPIFLDLLQIHTCISLWPCVNSCLEGAAVKSSLWLHLVQSSSHESHVNENAEGLLQAWCVQKLPALRKTGCHTLVKWLPVPRIVMGLWSANLLSPTIVSAYFSHERITSSAELVTYHRSGLRALDWTGDGSWLFIKRKSENMASFTFYNCFCCSRVITY